MDAQSQQLELATAERDKTELLKNATPLHFVKYLSLAAGSWVLFIFLGTVYFREYADQLGVLHLPAIFLYVAALLAALWFTFQFCHDWLAILTLKTPVRHRSKVHFIGALILASLYTFVDDDPLTALRKTMIYVEHHGFFVLKILGIGCLISAFAYALAKTGELNDFPRYPLRWYALLSAGSVIVGMLLRPEGDMSSAFHWYERIAHYTGTVIVAYVTFLFGASLGRRNHSARNVT